MFDFTKKLNFFENKVRMALSDKTELTLSTVFLDLVNNICTNDCIFCDRKFRNAEPVMFSEDRLMSMADELISLNVDSVVIVGEGGESLLNPYFVEFSKKLLDNGLHLGLYTNGSISDAEIIEVLSRFDFVRVSLDAGCQESHKTIHRSADENSFYKALDLIRKISAKNGSIIGASFIVLKENVGEIALAADMVKKAGAAYLEIKPMYTTEYDVAVLDPQVYEIAKIGIESCKHLIDKSFDVILNNQISSYFEHGHSLEEMVKSRCERLCISSKFRMVVSPSGCYYVRLTEAKRNIVSVIH